MAFLSIGNALTFGLTTAQVQPFKTELVAVNRVDPDTDPTTADQPVDPTQPGQDTDAP